ncbi:MAG: threonine/serine dehydratase [Bacillota bacterium]|nr:threonine/serine dehydratase [Bacillota bacterium]
MVTFEDIISAKERIEKYISVTPLDFSMKLSKDEMNVYLKLECQQKLKNFKIRGALSKITSLTEEEKERGIIASSSGNHASGISFASHLLGVKKSKVFVPETAPSAKIEKIKYYGAEVVQAGKNYDDTHKIALEVTEKENLTFVDSSSDVEVIAGQGTIALEILEQNPDIDIIVVPIGGGGIITGVSVAAKHIKPEIKIVGVQTAACPAMVKALADKKCYLEYPSEESICDALVGGVSEIPYKMAEQCIDRIVVVDESKIKQAITMLLLEEKVVAEPAGAVGVAAIISYPQLFKGKNVAVIITGGNIDQDLMKQLIIS